MLKSTATNLPSKPRALLFSLREALTLVHLPPHPSLPTLFDFTCSPTEAQLLLSLAPGHELFTYVNSTEAGRLHEPETKAIATALLKVLHHCHLHNVIHRDVKLDNVFWQPETGKLTLLDFGLATFVEEGKTLDEAVGCIKYVSTENVASLK